MHMYHIIFGSILIHLMCRPGNDAAPIGTLDQLDGSLEIQLSCKVGILLSILYELHL